MKKYDGENTMLLGHLWPEVEEEEEAEHVKKSDSFLLPYREETECLLEPYKRPLSCYLAFKKKRGLIPFIQVHRYQRLPGIVDEYYSITYRVEKDD